MSAVIKRSKKIYRAALLFETIFLLMTAILLTIWHKVWAVSFTLGAVSSFIPYCFFVYWIFFRKTGYQPGKLAAFYQGEIFKWIITIGLISAVFWFCTELNITAFFTGYFLSLLLNNLLPMCLFAHIKQNKI